MCTYPHMDVNNIFIDVYDDFGRRKKPNTQEKTNA